MSSVVSEPPQQSDVESIDKPFRKKYYGELFHMHVIIDMVCILLTLNLNYNVQDCDGLMSSFVGPSILSIFCVGLGARCYWHSTIKLF